MDGILIRVSAGRGLVWKLVIIRKFQAKQKKILTSFIRLDSFCRE